MLFFVGHQFRFTSIQSIEQRREYKSIFDKDYAEYRKLHEEIDNVSKRFADLEEKLRMEERSRKESSKVKVNVTTERNVGVEVPFNSHVIDLRTQEIQRMIVNEYKSKVQDSKHQSNKERSVFGQIGWGSARPGEMILIGFLFFLGSITCTGDCRILSDW